MIAFLAFFALIIALIVGCVCISVRLHTQDGVAYSSGRQFVTLHQEASIRGRSHDRPGSRRHMERSYKQHRSRLDVGMAECALRFASVGLVVIAVVAVLFGVLFFIH